MTLLANFYGRIGSLMPGRYISHITNILQFSGKRKIKAQEYLGSTMIFSLLISSAVLIIPYAIKVQFTSAYFIYAALVFILAEYLSYFVLYLGLEDYTKRIELMLPDFLRLTAANIRAGMTPFQAIKLAARPEFGPLSEEVAYVTVRGLGTESFSDLLLNMNNHIKSESLDRVLRLFSSTVKSGGHLAQILEESSLYIEEKRRLKKELSTITKSYSMFIMFSVVIISPFLLAISIQFLTMVINIQKIAPMSGSEVAGFGGTIAITVDFLRTGALVFLITTGILASMLTGIINQEKLQYGLKYSLIICTLAVGSFFLANKIIGSMFGAG